MTTLLTLLLAPALALLLAAGLTPVIRRVALGMGRVAVVRPDRWHRKPTPNIGGVAIFLGFAGAVAAATLLTPSPAVGFRADAPSFVPWSRWQGLLLASTFMFVVGLVDDFARIRPSTKLAGEVAAAAILLASGIGVSLTDVHALNVLVSLFWFVGVTNAMNLLDNMDGLTAGVGVVAAGVLATIFLMDGQTGLAVAALAFAGALLGFLAHNYPPARIFMGDSGSLFVGVFLSGLALAPTPGLSRGLFGVMAVPALILSVPILDTAFVTLGRLLERRPLSEGGRDHTSHGLVGLGVTEARAVWILWGLAAAGGGVGLLLRTADRGVAALLGIVLVAGLALLGVYLLSHRFGKERTAADGPGEAPSADALYDRILRFHHQLPVASFALDLLLLGAAYWGAYLVRWGPAELPAELAYFRRSLPVVLAVKVAVFSWAGMYAAGWRHGGAEDVGRVLRANLLASVAVAAALLLLDRVGISRGVLVADFFLASALTGVPRFFFQVMERATGHLSEEGVPAVVVGSAEDARLVLHEVQRSRTPRLRAVAVADADHPAERGRLRGIPLYGGPDGLGRALTDTGAHSVVVLRRGAASPPTSASGGPLPAAVRRHLEHRGALDVYALDVTLGRLPDDRRAGEPVPFPLPTPEAPLGAPSEVASDRDGE